MSDAAVYYLVTGATSGIGRALVAALLERPHAVVVATARDPAAAAARSLADLPKGDSARLVVLKFDASEPDVAAADAAAIVATLQTDHAVPRLDVVVSNAGAVTDTSPVAAVGADAMLTHFKINTLAPLALYQVLWPALLSKGGVQRPPVFLGVSSTAGRIQDALEMPLAAYGASKAALNFVVSKIHAENKDIIAFVVHPGWVKTKMGNAAAHIAGLDEAPLSIEESVAGLVKLIDTADREKVSGTFQVYNGNTLNY